MPRKIKSTTADDGTELELKRRSDGDYIVTEKGSDNRTGEVAQSKAAAERQLEETSRLYGTAENSRRNGRSESTGMDSGGLGLGGSMDMGGGMFDTGRSDDPDRDTGMDMGGGLGLGGDLFDGGGSLFGGGGGSSSGPKRDPDSGEFAPKRPRDTDFEMARDDDGQFTGRKDEEDNDGGGLFGFL